MNIAWLLADNTVLPVTADIQQLHAVAPIWGSWRTWRGYGTDNVVCYREADARMLQDQQYHTVCNLYMPLSVWTNLGSPPGMLCYGGEFSCEFDRCEDIISMHLAANQNTIVLMLGFRFDSDSDSAYNVFAAQVIEHNPKTQWVLVDHPGKLCKPFDKFANLTCDNLPNVLKLLTN